MTNPTRATFVATAWSLISSKSFTERLDKSPLQTSSSQLGTRKVLHSCNVPDLVKNFQLQCSEPKKSVETRMVELYQSTEASSQLYQSTEASSQPFKKGVGQIPPSPRHFSFYPLYRFLKRLHSSVAAFVVIFKKGSDWYCAGSELGRQGVAGGREQGARQGVVHSEQGAGSTTPCRE